MSHPPHRPSLVSLPPELSTLVFSHLPSLSDVFALAATCHTLRAVWYANTARIFERIGRVEIQQLDLARQLLSDQGGAPVGSAVLAPYDVRRMARNARKVEKSAERFGREVAARTPSDGFYYTPPDQSRPHPPYLTSTEKPRFFRAYYRVWSLLELDDSAWPDRFAKLTQRQLYRTAEMARLPQPLGEETGPDLKDVPFQVPARYPVPGRRSLLESTMFAFLSERHCRVFPTVNAFYDFRGYGTSRNMPKGGCAGMVTLFDHFVGEFWNAFHIDPREALKSPEYRKFVREELWGESSDEEAARPEWALRYMRRLK